MTAGRLISLCGGGRCDFSLPEGGRGEYIILFGEKALLERFFSEAAPSFAVQNLGESDEFGFDFSLAGNASLTVTFVAFAGASCRVNVGVSLNGEGAECNLNGLYAADGENSVQFDVRMDHRSGGCRSNQLFKGMAFDSGVTRFGGLIHVPQYAQKTEAYQANHNLLLSRSAKAFSKPQLEIYADDVKCSHGATVGRLNEDEIFYMRSRGISEKQAFSLACTAFAVEALSAISDAPLRDRILHLFD